jgi:hypothetical protein
MKVLPKGATSPKLVEGDESSDSEGLYEDPNISDDEQRSEEDTGEASEHKQVYCVSFWKKRGPLADFLETYKAFRQTCFKLNNAEKDSANMQESQSGE